MSKMVVKIIDCDVTDIWGKVAFKVKKKGYFIILIIPLFIPVIFLIAKVQATNIVE